MTETAGLQKEKEPPKSAFLTRGAAIFYASVDDCSDAVLWEKARLLLSPDRIGQAERLTQKTQARLSLSAALLLQKAMSVSGLLKEKDPLPPMARKRGGKPYFPDRAFDFSLSHAGSRVLCALSRRPVGCDLERFRTPNAALAERWFCPEEQVWLALARSPQEERERFFLLWTLKESYGKMTGEGIFSTARRFSVKLPPNFVPLTLPSTPFGHEVLPGQNLPIALRDGRILPSVWLSSFLPEHDYCLALCFDQQPESLFFYKIIF